MEINKLKQIIREEISKIINEKIVIAITPATKNQSLTSKYEAAVDINIGCKIDAGLIICTSGSTGNPKAVEISSQALITYDKCMKLCMI